MKTALIAQRFSQAQDSYNQHAIAQDYVAKQLLALMQQHCIAPHLQRGLEIGCGSGLFTHAFLQHYAVDQLFLNDLYPEVKQYFRNTEQLLWGIGDIEQLSLPQSLDIVLSCSALQWIKDFSRLAEKIQQALHPSGIFCFASYAENNLKEIKALTGQGLDYLNLHRIVELLTQLGFEILVAHEEQIQVDFNQPFDVLKHLKATGVHATADGFRWTKASLKQFEQDYAQFLTAENRYPLTYHPIYLIARKIS